jgi:hypothetical protein
MSEPKIRAHYITSFRLKTTGSPAIKPALLVDVTMVTSPRAAALLNGDLQFLSRKQVMG